MFKSLKKLIESRMGKNIVLEDFTNSFGYFIKIQPKNLYDVAYFLKHDPDVKLTLFDQILLIPPSYLPWQHLSTDLEILYQLRSLKLPYPVTLVLSITDELSIPSIKNLFAGALTKEQEVAKLFGVSIEEQE